MPIRSLYVSRYRSIRNLRLKLARVNVLTGPNGCGKSNLYQSMFLLARAATGQLARTLAQEGGMPSALWAGPSAKGAVRMVMGVELDNFSYELSAGLVQAVNTVFRLDPEVKEETVDFTGRGSKLSMLERKGVSAKIRGQDGGWTKYPLRLSANESILSQLHEPHLYPDLAYLRQELAAWRFYHHFRTEPDSPLRQPQTGVHTPVLAHDGADVAAALQTVMEIGDRETLDTIVARAFPGAALMVDQHPNSFAMQVQLKMPGLMRALNARELSDGTLRFLCLLAALLSPRPPALIALNEPETSLHPDLMEPLAMLISRAARDSQLWITTHSVKLAELIEKHTNQPPVLLELRDGETVLSNPQPL